MACHNTHDMLTIPDDMGESLFQQTRASAHILKQSGAYIPLVLGLWILAFVASGCGSGLSGPVSRSGGGLAGDEQAEIRPELEEALRARIIERNAGAFASYQFTHSLIRDTLYDELTTPERVRLHRLAGETIESLQAANLDPHLSQLAHHFLEAAKGGNP